MRWCSIFYFETILKQSYRFHTLRDITGDMRFPSREHISLGICVSHVGEDMSLGIRVSQVGEHISLGICVFQVGEHISLGICVS